MEYKEIVEKILKIKIRNWYISEIGSSGEVIDSNITFAQLMDDLSDRKDIKETLKTDDIIENVLVFLGEMTEAGYRYFNKEWTMCRLANNF